MKNINIEEISLVDLQRIDGLLDIAKKSLSKDNTRLNRITVMEQFLSDIAYLKAKRFITDLGLEVDAFKQSNPNGLYHYLTLKVFPQQ